MVIQGTLLEEPIGTCNGQDCPEFSPNCRVTCLEYLTYTNSFNDGIRPKPDISTSDWADVKFVLPKKGNKEPGPWRTSRTPYLKEIMDLLGITSPVQNIVVVKGTQLGFTAVALIWFAYIVDLILGSILQLLPTLDNARTHSRSKVQAVIDANPHIFKGKIEDPRSRESSNTLLNKEFPGGELKIQGANSAAALRHFTTKYVVRDEKAAYPHDLEGEGDPGGLSGNRADTYGDEAKFYDLSTPLFPGDAIDQDWQDSSQARYEVPCPHCKKKQWLKWKDVKGNYRIIFKHENYKLIGDVKYKCENPKCGKLIDEHHKTWMFDFKRAGWVHKYPGREIKGYHLSSLYSPLGWLSWRKMAIEFLKAKKAAKVGDRTLLKRFIQTRLAQTWDDTRRPDIESNKLLERRENFKDIIPMQALLLTAAVDIHKTWVEIEFKAWAPGKESFTMDIRIVHGNFQDKAVQDTVKDVLFTPWQHESGAEITMSVALVDAGYRTTEVYDFTRPLRRRRVFPVMGSRYPGKPIIEIPRKLNKHKVKLCYAGTDNAKDSLYGRLEVEKTDSIKITETELYKPLTDQPVELYPGYMHFNMTCDEEYMAQLVSEVPEVKQRGSRYIRRYVQIRERNEAVDLNGYNEGALMIACGMRNPKPAFWQKLVNRLAKQVEKLKAEGKLQPPSKTYKLDKDKKLKKSEAPVEDSTMETQEQEDKKPKRKTRRRRGGFIYNY